MEYALTHAYPEKQYAACILAGVFAEGELSSTAKQIDAISNGYLKKLLNRGDISGKAEHILLLQDVPNLPAQRVLLVGCGKKAELTGLQFRKIIAKAFNALKNTGATDAIFYTSDWDVVEYDLLWQLSTIVTTIGEQRYCFDELKSKKEDNKCPLQKITFHIPQNIDGAAAEKALRQGEALTKGMTLFKDLVNMPANYCTPTFLGETAKNLDKEYRSLKLKILEETDMKRLGMGALLSVSRGSKEPAKLIILEYTGSKNTHEQPIALIGKGVTFDSGGLSLKPPAGMMDMKYDMSGAGCVLGLMHAIAELALPLNIVAVIPATENLPGGRATKPGDVVNTLSGQTVEILNTDAEGRLILCDALTYVERHNPAAVIDMATLTGAMVVALGHHRTGIFSNNADLAQELVAAGDRTTDKAWHMPMDPEYDEQLKSAVADMANISRGRDAGSITAACYLGRFTKKYPWAHLDIAGTTWNSTDNKGCTGRPMPLLLNFLLHRCNTATD
ncbi:MAG: leucyl aminopeptidase [Gammaproteobacteria bacterium]